MPKSKALLSESTEPKKKYKYNYICQKSAQTIVDIKYKNGMKKIYSPFADEVIDLLEENLITIEQ